MIENRTEKDVCEFYGVSKEQCDFILSGVGSVDALKKYGIELDEAKLHEYEQFMGETV